MPYQQEMKVRHAVQVLKKCRDREANAARLYGRRVRESERAEHTLRYEQQRVEAKVICAALSRWEAR